MLQFKKKKQQQQQKCNGFLLAPCGCQMGLICCECPCCNSKTKKKHKKICNGFLLAPCGCFRWGSSVASAHVAIQKKKKKKKAAMASCLLPAVGFRWGSSVTSANALTPRRCRTPATEGPRALRTGERGSWALSPGVLEGLHGKTNERTPGQMRGALAWRGQNLCWGPCPDTVGLCPFGLGKDASQP